MKTKAASSARGLENAKHESSNSKFAPKLVGLQPIGLIANLAVFRLVQRARLS